MAALSNDLFAATVVVYSLAMLCFAVDFAFARRAATAPASAVTVPPAPVAVPAQLVEPALVGAPAAPAVALPAPAVPAPPPGPSADIRRPWPAPVSGAGRLAVVLTLLGWLAHAGEVSTRGLAVHRVPWGNMYEFSSVVALVAVGVFLVLLLRYRIRWLGLFVLLPVVLYLGLAGTVLFVKAGPLVPALNSYWIAIHVVAAMLATGTFMVAGVVACLHIARLRVDRRIAAGTDPTRLGLTARLPAAARLDLLEYRVVSFAFPVWTFAIIAGAIWAESAWGRYWGWDPKETWSFITWVVYAAYLHSRSTAGWRRAAPYIALTGFVALLFNYYVINIFISGLHSYAGV